MTTTTTTLDPQLKPIINAVKKAHAKAKLPGTFLALLPESNRYFVLDGKRGAVKYQYVLSGSKLTVRCRWSVAGSPQYKQSTVKI